MFGGEINVLSQKSVEQNIAGIIRQSNEKVCEVRVGKQKYQIVRSDETKMECSWFPIIRQGR